MTDVALGVDLGNHNTRAAVVMSMTHRDTSRALHRHTCACARETWLYQTHVTMRHGVDASSQNSESSRLKRLRNGLNNYSATWAKNGFKLANFGR